MSKDENYLRESQPAKLQESSALPTPELGTISDLDDEILRTQGHEAEMPRSFSPIAAVGLAFSITGSWVGYASSFGANVIFGGPQNVVLADGWHGGAMDHYSGIVRNRVGLSIEWSELGLIS